MSNDNTDDPNDTPSPTPDGNPNGDGTNANTSPNPNDGSSDDSPGGDGSSDDSPGGDDSPGDDSPGDDSPTDDDPGDDDPGDDEPGDDDDGEGSDDENEDSGDDDSNGDEGSDDEGSDDEGSDDDAAIAERFKRIIRDEAMVTESDVRIEVARTVERTISGDEHVLVHNRQSHFRGNLHVGRGSRKRVVRGNYKQDTDKSDIISFKDSYSEKVHGGVFQQASLEAEHIIGGAYIGMWAGVVLRTCAWADFLAWGGWADADTTRIEIVGLSIRAYMDYSHAAGARITKALMLVDDWVLRTENIGTLIDNHGDAIKLGGPGSGMEVHA